MKSLRLSEIKAVWLMDYHNTKNNLGEYTVRYIIHDCKIGESHKIHIIKDNVPELMISLYSDKLQDILKLYGLILIIDL